MGDHHYEGEFELLEQALAISTRSFATATIRRSITQQQQKKHSEIYSVHDKLVCGLMIKIRLLESIA
jgi:hypothetical protein